MNCANLILAYLMVGSLPSVLGIMCKKCTPSEGLPLVLCDRPSQIKEVNCDNETAPAPNVTFDACTSGKIVANLGTTYVYECTVKNSSDPSTFNCTTTQERICSDAQSRLSSLSQITINSCQAKCCDTNSCNVRELIDQPPATDGTTTEASTTEAPTRLGPTAESGVGKIQSFALLVSFLIFLTFCWFKQLE
ncbi:uncharacterized protein [Porites lutea]|uniref:uncharacterized protein n=1 Tax=Porites lutea TaxID=51062 RepID=UPI003CC5B607